MIDIKTATIEELRKQFYMMINAGTLTDEQSNLLDKIVDEINEREGRSYTKENLNILYSYYLGKYNLTDNVLPENAGAIDFILAILESCSGEEFRRLRTILSEQGSLADESKETHTGANDPLSSKDAEPPQVKPKPKYFRSALIAASVVFVFSLVSITAQTLGFDFFGALAKWTQDAVYFVRGEQGEDRQSDEMDFAYERLKTVLDMHNIRVDIPRYIPKWYEFDTIEPDNPTEFSPITAWFVRENDEFSVMVKRMEQDVAVFSEINDEEDSEVYNGKYLITSNRSRMVAVWHQGDYELCIQGNLTYEELTKILDSIK